MLLLIKGRNMNTQKYIVLAGLLLTQSLIMSGVTMADVMMNHRSNKKMHKRIPGKAPELDDATDRHPSDDFETPYIIKH